jgi:hypothetical protein
MCVPPQARERDTRSAIFIRSYWKDLQWLQFSLRSIGLYCFGFSEIVVVLPQSSRRWLDRSPLPRAVRVEYCPTYRDDYLGQQVTKLFADTYVDANFIVHVHADCIFTRPTSPLDLHPDGRPIVVTKRLAQLGRTYPWRTATQAFLGCEILHDFMQQPPFAYPRWLYPMIREHCLVKHGAPLDTYILSRPPRGFSEFNVLGAYAWLRHRPLFDFRDAGSREAPAPCCDWHWSWGGLTPAVRAAIAERLAPPTNRENAR